MTAIEDDFIRRLDRAPLDANALADRYQAFRARDELLTTLHERLHTAAMRGVSGAQLSALAAEMNWTDFHGFLSRYDWQQRADLGRFPQGYPTPWRLGSLHHDVGVLEAAGGRSPAAMYADARENEVAGLSDSARTVVRALTDSDMSVQPLKILDDPRGYGTLGSIGVEGRNNAASAQPAIGERNTRTAPSNARHWSQQGRQVIRAVALAAHDSGARVLAIPVTHAARIEARIRRYAHHTADDPNTAIDKLVGGAWKKPPPGALIIVDDADELSTKQVCQLAGYAASTNAKLLLVTADREGIGLDDPTRCPERGDSWNRTARESTDALAHQLPWAQHLGSPADYQLCAAAADTAGQLNNYLSALTEIPDDIAHREASALLERHGNLIGSYRDLARPVVSRDTGREAPSRDCGIAL